MAGARIARDRADHAADLAAGRLTEADLAAVFEACTSPLWPRDLSTLRVALAHPAPAPHALPTVAHLAAEATGTDWPALFARSFGLWAAGRFDRGHALWSLASGQGAYAAWREWATHDPTPEVAGLTGFCAHVAAAPDTAERTILRAADRLGLSEAAAGTAFHRLLMDLGGWAQHARWLLWEAELAGGTDATLADLLAIRLVWEEALVLHAPQVAASWARVVEAHAAPVTLTADHVIDAILQEASERAHQRRLAALLTGPRAGAGRPALQAAFCIDGNHPVVAACPG